MQTFPKRLAVTDTGKVGVDSVVGAGSTFWAELPLPGAEPAWPRPPTSNACTARAS